MSKRYACEHANGPHSKQTQENIQENKILLGVSMMALALVIPLSSAEANHKKWFYCEGEYVTKQMLKNMGRKDCPDSHDAEPVKKSKSDHVSPPNDDDDDGSPGNSGNNGNNNRP